MNPSEYETIEEKTKTKNDTPIPILEQLSSSGSENDRDYQPKLKISDSSSAEENLELDSGDEEVINQMLDDDDPDVARIIDSKGLM